MADKLNDTRSRLIWIAEKALCAGKTVDETKTQILAIECNTYLTNEEVTQIKTDVIGYINSISLKY